MDEPRRVPLAIKIVIGFFLLSAVVWTIGQGGAVVSYDAVAEMGLQEPREGVDPVIVEVNRGIGFADFAIMVPLFVVAVIGLWRLRFFGAVAAWLVLGINIYWPVVAWAKQFLYASAAVKSQPFDVATHGILAFVFLFSVWASWYLHRKRELFWEI